MLRHGVGNLPALLPIIILTAAFFIMKKHVGQELTARKAINSIGSHRTALSGHRRTIHTYSNQRKPTVVYSNGKAARDAKNSMGHSTSEGEDVLRLLWHPTVHNRTHKSHLKDAIVNQKYSVHTIPHEDRVYISHLGLPSGRFPISTVPAICPAHLKIAVLNAPIRFGKQCETL
jgi:hypothetical protein